jgi:HSP20 family protein
MQTDNRRQDQSQRDESPSRDRESRPAARQTADAAGENAAARGGSMPTQQGAVQRASQRSNYGLARRDTDYGFPSVLGAGGPFSLLRRMEQEMDRMFEQFRLGSYGGQSRLRGGSEVPSLWAPQIEIYERDGKLHVCTDLPGINKDDVRVNIEDDMVTIQGERRSSNESDQQGFYRSERSYGSFYRSIALPEGVNVDSAEANFRDGVLDITFDAPVEQKRSRTVEIKGGPSQPSTQAIGSGGSTGSGTSGGSTTRSGSAGPSTGGTSPR